MSVEVKRRPLTTTVPAAGMLWPSTSSELICQEPCSRSRSVIFFIFDRAPRHAQRLPSFAHAFQNPVALSIVFPFIHSIRLYRAVGSIAAFGGLFAAIVVFE